MNIVGMSTFLFPMEFFAFWQENTFITPLLMMSLCYITNDVIMTSKTLLKTINKHALDSEVHNTARFQ